MRVECYSGYRAEERPLRFTLGNLMHEVIVIKANGILPAFPGFAFARMMATSTCSGTMTRKICGRSTHIALGLRQVPDCLKRPCDS